MLYFGCVGNKIEKTAYCWCENIAKWLNISNNFQKECNNNFFCYRINFKCKTMINIEKADFILDGLIINNENSIHTINYSNIKEVIEICKTGNANGYYTVMQYDQNKFEVYNDYYGKKAFYYYYDKSGKLFFSNDIRLLLLNEDVPFKVNITKCKKYFYNIVNDSDNTETYFKDIKKLNEGSRLLFYNNSLSINNIFDSTNIKVNDYYFFPNKTEYYDLFKKKLNSLIKNIVSSEKKIGVSLSGGIDSSIILASLIELGYRDKIICYHASSHNPQYYTCNDSDIVKRLLSDLKVKGKIFYQDEGNSICNADIGRDWICNINGPCPVGNDSFSYKLSAELEKDNVGILLGGDGGDYMFTGTRYCGDMLMYNGMKKTANERIRYFNNVMPKHKFKIKFLNKWVYNFPILSNFCYKKIFWPSETGKNNYPEYFTTEMKRLNKSYVFKQKKVNPSKNLKIWGRRFIYDFMFPKGSADDEHFDGFEFIHPLLDKSIYDYAQRTPSYIHYDIYRGMLGQYIVQKRVLREAYKNILPNYITEQQNKTNYSPSLILKFKKDRDNIFNLFFSVSTICLAKFNIVNQNLFLSKLKIFLKMLDDPHFVPNVETKYMTNLIYMEIWLREMSKGRRWMLENCKIHSSNITYSVEVIN